MRFWAACIARTHGNTLALLLLKRRLQHGALDCVCSHVTLHDSTTDVCDKDMQQALAQVCANLLSKQARHDAEQELLTSEQRQPGRWCCESPSTGMLYEYVTQLADCWLHVLVLPVNTVVSTTMQVGQLQEKWQAHAKTACLGHAHCRQLRQWLVHEKPAAVEAALCRAAVKCAGRQVH